MNPFYAEGDACIYEALAPLGLVLCGGYSRDMLLGRSPKDMDFVVLGSDHQAWADDNWEKLQGIIEDLGGEVKMEYFKYSARCACLIDFMVSERQVQVVLPRLPAKTPEEAVSLFQWNFNHAFFDPEFEEHHWALGVLPTIRWRKAIWMCSFEAPHVDPKYPEKLPGWDFSYYGGPHGLVEQVWSPD